MNIIFFFLIFISFCNAGYHELTWVPKPETLSPMQVLTEGIVSSAQGAVELALGLVGVMAFFLGLMKVAEEAGLLKIIARIVRPIMVRLFPDVPPEHPAMGAMIMNISANAMGLGNAATPFGIRAMQELDKLNSDKGTASNAMALFLAINTSSVTLLPTGVIALRAAAGSNDPAGILPTTLFATLCSTIVAILAAKFYQRFFPSPASKPSEDGLTLKTSCANLKKVIDDRQKATEKIVNNDSAWHAYFALVLLVALIPLSVIYGKEISPWIIPCLVVGFLGFGFVRGVSVYEVFVQGAKEGFQVALKIIPYLVAILVAVGMFRNSGTLNLLIDAMGGTMLSIGLPAEALPMALMRPLSGSGAFGILAEVINNPAIGPDSYIGILVSTLQGSTETTFYVLAVYFGAVQIRKTRHALAAGLTADVAGILGAVAACSYFYG